MTTKFSEWLNDRTEHIGGAKGLFKAMPEYCPQHIAAWSLGLRSPGYRAQLELSAILREPLSVVRSYLNRPSTEFSELLARKILAHGDFTNFCLESGIGKPRLDKWVAEGKLPSNAKLGSESKDLRMLRDALILWGDETPPNVLMAELVLAAERTIAAKESKDNL